MLCRTPEETLIISKFVLEVLAVVVVGLFVDREEAEDDDEGLFVVVFLGNSSVRKTLDDSPAGVRDVVTRSLSLPPPLDVLLGLW